STGLLTRTWGRQSAAARGRSRRSFSAPPRRSSGACGTSSDEGIDHAVQTSTTADDVVGGQRARATATATPRPAPDGLCSVPPGARGHPDDARGGGTPSGRDGAPSSARGGDAPSHAGRSPRGAERASAHALVAKPVVAGPGGRRGGGAGARGWPTTVRRRGDAIG